jgi:hypothetical protein
LEFKRPLKVHLKGKLKNKLHVSARIRFFRISTQLEHQESETQLPDMDSQVGPRQTCKEEVAIPYYKQPAVTWT